MKVIITTDCYAPQKNGVQFVTQFQAEKLAEGFDVTVITSATNNQQTEEIINGVKVKRVKLSTKYGYHFGDKKDYIDLVLQESRTADVLICTTTQSATTDLLLKVIKKIQTNKILYMHGMQEFKFVGDDFRSIKTILFRVYKILRWRMYYVCNKSKIKSFNVVTHLHERDFAYRYFTKKYKNNNKVIMNAAEDSFFQTRTEETNLINKYFINVSNYSLRKNQEIILKAYYRSGIRDIGLVLIGSKENSYYKKLIKLNKNLEKTYGSRSINILHSLDRNSTIKYIKHSYAVVMASLWEAFPITLVEGMAAGKAFISSKVGVSEYLPGGVIAHEFMDLIYWLKFYSVQNDFVANLGKIGQDYAKKELTINSQSNKLKSIIYELAGEAYES